MFVLLQVGKECIMLLNKTQPELQANHSTGKDYSTGIIRFFKIPEHLSTMFVSQWTVLSYFCKCQPVILTDSSSLSVSLNSMFPCLYLLSIAETYDCCFKQIYCLLANRKILFQTAFFYQDAMMHDNIGVLPHQDPRLLFLASPLSFGLNIREINAAGGPGQPVPKGWCGNHLSLVDCAASRLYKTPDFNFRSPSPFYLVRTDLLLSYRTTAASLPGLLTQPQRSDEVTHAFSLFNPVIPCQGCFISRGLVQARSEPSGWKS